MAIKIRPSAKKNGSKSPTTASRKQLEGKGQAMPGGRYPIPNVDFLKRAIRSIGRTPPDKRAAVVSWIKKRAAALGKPQLAANLSNAADKALELAGASAGSDCVPMKGTKKEKVNFNNLNNKNVQSRVKGSKIKTKEGKMAYARLRAQGYDQATSRAAALKHEQGLNNGEWANDHRSTTDLAFKAKAPKGDTPGSKDADGDTDNDSPANVSAKKKLGLQNHQALQTYAKARKKGLNHGVALKAARSVDKKLGNPKSRAKTEMTGAPLPKA